jgi:4-amino-4-deoxy-L-arabinose transferase-like glycosyltransferase
VWWLAVGAAAGCALLSKYSAMFFGVAIVIWLIAVPKLRHWLWSPWLWLGGVVALALFSPVILWNADHGWVSFIKQFGRARIEDFRPAFIAELVPTQVGFATPLVFILGAMGLHAMAWRNSGAFAARALVNCMFWTIVAYFIWHSLHARVEANWFAPVYPAFAVAAAVAANLTPWEGWRRRLADFCRRWAAPTGILLFVLLIVQANTGLLTGYRRDARCAASAGWPESREIRGNARAGRCDLRARAGLRHHELADVLFRRAPASRNSRSASAGPACRSRSAALSKLLYVDDVVPDGGSI